MVNFGCQAPTLAPWGSQLLSERTTQDREHWEPLKQEQVLPAALLGGGISEQQAGGGTALLRIEGKRGLPNSPNRLWGCPGYHQGRGWAECPRTSLLDGPKEITEHIFTWIQQ